MGASSSYLQSKRSPSSAPSGSVGFLQRQRVSCESGLTDECEEPHQTHQALERRAINQTRPGTVPPVVDEVLRSAGQPLDLNARGFMESRFGHDFSQVRVHADARAAESARAVNALAYTVGRNVVFGANEYAPATQRGRGLLAHELAHTLQQRNATGAPPSTDPHGIFESSADAAGRDIANGQAVSHEFPACGIGLSRALVSPDGFDDQQLAQELKRVTERLKKRTYPGRDWDVDWYMRLKAITDQRAKAKQPVPVTPPKPSPEDIAREREAAIAEAEAEAKSIEKTEAEDGSDEGDVAPAAKGAPRRKKFVPQRPTTLSLIEPDPRWHAERISLILGGIVPAALEQLDKELEESSKLLDKRLSNESKIAERWSYQQRLNQVRSRLKNNSLSWYSPNEALVSVRLSGEEVWNEGVSSGQFLESEKRIVYEDQNSLQDLIREEQEAKSKRLRKQSAYQQQLRGEQFLADMNAQMITAIATGPARGFIGTTAQLLATPGRAMAVAQGYRIAVQGHTEELPDFAVSMLPSLFFRGIAKNPGSPPIRNTGSEEPSQIPTGATSGAVPQIAMGESDLTGAGLGPSSPSTGFFQRTPTNVLSAAIRGTLAGEPATGGTGGGTTGGPVRPVTRLTPAIPDPETMPDPVRAAPATNVPSAPTRVAPAPAIPDPETMPDPVRAAPATNVPSAATRVAPAPAIPDPETMPDPVRAAPATNVPSAAPTRVAPASPASNTPTTATPQATSTTVTPPARFTLQPLGGRRFHVQVQPRTEETRKEGEPTQSGQKAQTPTHPATSGTTAKVTPATTGQRRSAAKEAPLITRFDPTTSVAPAGYRLVRPPQGEFPHLEERTVIEFPGGERVFRQSGAERGITIESKLGPASGRQRYEEEMFRRGEMDPEYVRSNMERAHAHGQGTGYESPYAITYAPPEVNQALQNTGIELYLRELERTKPPGVDYNLVTTTYVHPRSRRMRAIEYRVDATLAGERRKMFQVKIEVSDSLTPTVRITEPWLNPDLADALPLHDLPPTIAERLRYILTRGASFPAVEPPQRRKSPRGLDH
jgi:hypothetical protein